MAADDTPSAVNALLKAVMGKCRRLLDQGANEEADLREALSWLKMAHDMADPVLIFAGMAHNSPIFEASSAVMMEILRMVRGINPALTTLERACDPKYVVVARATRQGAGQPREFDPSPLKEKFNTEKAKLYVFEGGHCRRRSGT